ncbi:MAG: hypothetical protein LUF33_06830 [Clostridiales bacterium]|nr:hypothetical protein [Clostridiales bacterium]
MHLIDLHCDALYKSVISNISLDDSSLETKLNKNKYDRKLQCYAVWLPDKLSGDKAEKFFYSAYERLTEECQKHNIILLNNNNLSEMFYANQNTAFFTVENSLALNGKIENVKNFLIWALE